VVNSPDFWDTYREQVRNQQRTMPVFAKAPLILREGLIFPYLGGAEFMLWWSQNGHAVLPLGSQLPLSTEQVLHPERYVGKDTPVLVRFADSTADVLYEDTLGELEIDILLAVLRGSEEAALAVPLGWGGDRYRVYRTPDGPALVWYLAWDGQPMADRFRQQMTSGFIPRARPGYRASVEALTIGGKPGLRIVHAPLAWPGRMALPAVR
jgi:hypothetical protein